ncbi:hypothetical protein [Alteromonas sp. AMM-1]|uniref:hypothetical protein n=1 Tax=Alteromonas sp. AMM-1 TaxID=3394233 RepID=UPI0039A66DAD
MSNQPSYKSEIDIGLDILCILATDGQTLSAPDIADVCGCSTQRIYEIQQSALNKARRIANRLNLIDYYNDL